LYWPKLNKGYTMRRSYTSTKWQLLKAGEIWLPLVILAGIIAFITLVIGPSLINASQPTSMATDSQGNIYIATAANFSDISIKKLDSNAHFRLSLGKNGSGEGEFDSIHTFGGIAVNHHDNIYVVGYYDRIDQFDNQGHFLKSWHIDLNGNKAALAFDSQDFLYIARTNAPHLLKVDQRGQIVSSWGDTGLSDGSLGNTLGLTIDQQDYLYVADINNQRVQKFDTAGNFLTEWNPYPVTKPELASTYWSIYADTHNNIYVGDHFAIKKFDNNGHVLTTLGGTQGRAANQFNLAAPDLVTDLHDNIYALDSTDSTVSRLQKFDSSGHLLLEATLNLPFWLEIVESFLLVILFILATAIITHYIQRKLQYRQDLALVAANLDPNHQFFSVDHLNLAQIRAFAPPKPPTFQFRWTLIISSSLGVGLAFLLLLAIGVKGTTSTILVVFIAILMVVAVGFAIYMGMRPILRYNKANNDLVTNAIVESIAIATRATPNTPSVDTANLDIGTNCWLFLWLILTISSASIFGFSFNSLITSWLYLLWPTVPTFVIPAVVILGIVLWLLLALASLVVLGQIRPVAFLINWQDWCWLAKVLLATTALILLVIDLLAFGIVLIWGKQSSTFFTNTPPGGLLQFFYYGLLFLLLGIFDSWIETAWKAADYATALRRVHFVRQLYPIGSAFFRGQLLTLEKAGQLATAEQLIQQNLALIEMEKGQRSTDSKVSYLEILGRIVLKQGRYPEALRIFEKVAQLKPKSASVYSDMATVYLYQNIQPQRALELIDLAIENKDTSPVSSDIKNYLWGEFLGNRAWALAQLGRYAEAQKIVKQAFQKTNPDNHPALAGLYYRAGSVLLLSGEQDRAIATFQEVLRYDSSGLYFQWTTAILDLIKQPNQQLQTTATPS
jgi:tetratricopeptide (TPR) repeat protein